MGSGRPDGADSACPPAAVISVVDGIGFDGIDYASSADVASGGGAIASSEMSKREATPPPVRISPPGSPSRRAGPAHASAPMLARDPRAARLGPGRGLVWPSLDPGDI